MWLVKTRHDNLVCPKTAWCLRLSALCCPCTGLAANRQHTQIQTEHCVSFWRCLYTLKIISCDIIYLASDNYTLVTLISPDELLTHCVTACLGAPETWEPWARWIRRPWFEYSTVNLELQYKHIAEIPLTYNMTFITLSQLIFLL